MLEVWKKQKVNLYSCSYDCGFKKFENIEKEKLSKSHKTMLTYFLKCRGKTECKNPRTAKK